MPQPDYPDSPPESFRLSKDAELDWFDRNAFFERKESAKGMATPSSTNNPNPNSQRYISTPANVVMKSKASMIIGLPKTQKHGLDPKNRWNTKSGATPMFPKQSGSVGKSGLVPPPVEPSSPKVSCMGRVRADKDSHDELLKRRKFGFFSILRSGCRDGRAVAVHAPTAESPARKSSAELSARDIRERLPPGEAGRRSSDSVDGEPARLGGMVRFVSGRRSESWGQL